MESAIPIQPASSDGLGRPSNAWRDDSSGTLKLGVDGATKAGKWLYRATNTREHPANIRFPDEQSIRNVAHCALRALVLTAIADGNNSGANPFLHCASDIDVCKRIYWKRKALYSGRMVKFPYSALSQDQMIDLTRPKDKALCLKPCDSVLLYCLPPSN